MTFATALETLLGADPQWAPWLDTLDTDDQPDPAGPLEIVDRDDKAGRIVLTDGADGLWIVDRVMARATTETARITNHSGPQTQNRLAIGRAIDLWSNQP